MYFNQCIKDLNFKIDLLMYFNKIVKFVHRGFEIRKSVIHLSYV